MIETKNIKGSVEMSSLKSIFLPKSWMLGRISRDGRLKQSRTSPIGFINAYINLIILEPLFLFYKVMFLVN